jgi:hypothetical protein
MAGNKIVLQFKPEAFEFLTKTIEVHKDTIHKCQMNPLFKEELLKDMSKIGITIKNAKKGEADG